MSRAAAHLLGGFPQRAYRRRLHPHSEVDWPYAGTGRAPRGEGQQRRDRAAAHEQQPIRRRATGSQHAGELCFIFHSLKSFMISMN